MQELEAGPLHRFGDWPNEQVPRRAAGVYTVWEGDRLLYVGMSGRAMTAEDLEMSDGGRIVAKGLWTRLNAHASGRRSGDQFCVYVGDRFVVPALTRSQQQQLAAGTLSLDASSERSSASGWPTGFWSPPMEARRPVWRELFDEGRSRPVRRISIRSIRSGTCNAMHLVLWRLTGGWRRRMVDRHKEAYLRPSDRGAP